MAPTRLETLNAFRFFSAMALVLFHVLPIWPNLAFGSLPPAVISAHSWLIVGLPFFYALSGFVLFHSYAERIPETGASVRAFYRRRFARLTPVFYLSIVVVVPLTYLALQRSGSAQPLEEVGRAAVLSLLFLSAWFPSALLLNFPTWSVSVEMFFYLLFPFLVNRRGISSARSLLVKITIIYVASAVFFLAAGAAFPGLLAWPWLPGNLSPRVTSFFQLNPLVHLPEFISGILLAKLWRAKGGAAFRGGGADRMILAGVAGLALLAWSPLRPPFLMVASFLTLPLLSLLLWGGACPRRYGSRWLESGPLVYLGESAYAIYVLHMPLAKFWLGSDWVHSAPVAGFLAYLFILSAGAALIHRIFEAPLRKWIAGERSAA